MPAIHKKIFRSEKDEKNLIKKIEVRTGMNCGTEIFITVPEAIRQKYFQQISPFCSMISLEVFKYKPNTSTFNLVEEINGFFRMLVDNSFINKEFATKICNNFPDGIGGTLSQRDKCLFFKNNPSAQLGEQLKTEKNNEEKVFVKYESPCPAKMSH